MTLWVGEKPLILASQSKSRQALLQAAGIDFEAIPAGIDERGIQAASGLKDPRRSQRCLRNRRHACGAATARSRRGRRRSNACPCRSGSSASRPDASRRPASCARLRGKTHELHSAIAVRRTARSCSRMFGGANDDARHERCDHRTISRCGRRAAVTTSVGALPARRAWRAPVREDRGRSLHDSRPAAVATFGACAARSGCD